MSLKIAFVAGYCPIKLPQKLTALHRLDEVKMIDLFCKDKYESSDMPKLSWIKIPSCCGVKIFQEFFRLIFLLAMGARYDLFIGCHQTYHGVWAWLAGKIWRRPVIQMIITDVDWVNSRKIPALAMLSADACGVRGPVSADKLRRLGFRKQIETLHNAIKTMPRLPDGVSVIDKEYDLLSVADYAAEKDFPWMLDIVKTLSLKMPSLKLAIAGKGHDCLRSLIKEKGLDNNIILKGPLYGTDLALLFKRSRGLLISSGTEGLPMAALEAFSFGLPVFASGVGELPWLVRDHIDGRLIPHGSTEAMVAAISETLNSPDLLEQMNSNAKERFDSLMPEFTDAAISECWKRLIESALK